ncbi:uncharacterized protein LOC142340670 [Convolutriloba macropyga]|uniref:uncharacterized protein LOC142340670 n=1 Tax=Convolutriloba macropyga TaxID=536237 RepID=UPI003F51ADBF
MTVMMGKYLSRSLKPLIKSATIQVIAPETVEGTKYNGIPIPVPPDKVLEQYDHQLKIASNLHNSNTTSTSSPALHPGSTGASNQKGAPVISERGEKGMPTGTQTPKLMLVAFYETPTTWQWVSENQLEPLFTDEALDEAKLEEPRKSVDKLKVRVAYSKARRAYELFSGQRDPTDDVIQ